MFVEIITVTFTMVDEAVSATGLAGSKPTLTPAGVWAVRSTVALFVVRGWIIWRTTTHVWSSWPTIAALVLRRLKEKVAEPALDWEGAAVELDADVEVELGVDRVEDALGEPELDAK
ncbi:MAG: hypothetical protein JRM86_03030 [Nitrososphaerota archaeon]|nr:hypothetical protein [Nitrososphaerota archaeon]MDG7005888.1 hypothetical protein [Nitrososphaerota archaeon]